MKTEKFSIRYKNDIPEGLSIAIPFHGRYENVTSIVSDIHRYAKGFEYEILLLDDKSPNTDFINKFNRIPFMKQFQSAEHRGFGACVNTGLKYASYKTFMVVHSDCKIDSNLFAPLFNCLTKFDLVSPKTNNCIEGDESQNGDRSLTEDVLIHENYLSLYAFMIKRDVFRKLGGLKEYRYAFYENKELAIRMAFSKLKQGVCGSAFIQHAGHLTVTDVARKSQEARQQMQDNENLYIKDLNKLVNNAR